MYIKQLMLLMKAFQLKIQQDCKSEKKSALKIDEFIEDCNIINFNLFKILNFVKESKLGHKVCMNFIAIISILQLIGIARKMNVEIKNISPLNELEIFLQRLIDSNSESRVLYSEDRIKYFILTPSIVMNGLLREDLHSLIIAGGTLGINQ